MAKRCHRAPVWADITLTVANTMWARIETREEGQSPKDLSIHIRCSFGEFRTASAPRSRASPTSAASGLLVAAELRPARREGSSPTAASRAGLVVNAVTPTALRFAPSLLVTDAEIDEAVAILDRVLTAATAGAGRRRAR